VGVGGGGESLKGRPSVSRGSIVLLFIEATIVCSPLMCFACLLQRRIACDVRQEGWTARGRLRYALSHSPAPSPGPSRAHSPFPSLAPSLAAPCALSGALALPFPPVSTGCARNVIKRPAALVIASVPRTPVTHTGVHARLLIDLTIYPFDHLSMSVCSCGGDARRPRPGRIWHD